MKNLRHSKLIEIIGRDVVETQDDLKALLKNEGFDVTQATISRDIKALRVYKSLSQTGQYHYTLMPEPPESIFSSRLRTIFRESVTHIDHAQNLTVIKTLPGMGQAACSAIDAMYNPMVVGSLAGDDTAFIAMRTETAAKDLAVQLRVMLGE
jgi:transcriptional regulator of arginine metabolism